MSLASWENDVEMSLTKLKNKSAILKRIEFYRQNRYLNPNNQALLRAVLRLEWENVVLKETLKQKNIGVRKIFKAYKDQTYLKKLDRAIDEYFKAQSHEDTLGFRERFRERLEEWASSGSGK